MRGQRGRRVGVGRLRRDGKRGLPSRGRTRRPSRVPARHGPSTPGAEQATCLPRVGPRPGRRRGGAYLILHDPLVATAGVACVLSAAAACGSPFASPLVPRSRRGVPVRSGLASVGGGRPLLLGDMAVCPCWDLKRAGGSVPWGVRVLASVRAVGRPRAWRYSVRVRLRFLSMRPPFPARRTKPASVCGLGCRCRGSARRRQALPSARGSGER